MTANITSSQILPEQELLITTDTGEAQLYYSRKFNFDQEITNEDKFIFIPRNPISICISAYYSYGYTHREMPTLNGVEFARFRDNVRKQGLDTYISRNIKAACDKIHNMLHFNCDNKTIIPYELMVTNFSDFLNKYMAAIDMSSSYQSILSSWSNKFIPIEDQSDLIESGLVTTHKRTTDIYEWKQKPDPNQLQDMLERHPVINEYLELLSTYNL